MSSDPRDPPSKPSPAPDAAPDPLEPSADERANPQELARAKALADALDHDRGASSEDADHDLVELARSLRAAHLPSALAPAEHQKILSRALAAAPRAASRGRVIRVSFGVASALALAAGLAFMITRPRADGGLSGEDVTATLVRSRSTASLFVTPFKPGDGAARIDRIAVARERDYRENHFSIRRAR